MDERLILVFMLFFLVVFYVDGSACGNNVLEEGEVCDNDRLGGENCTNFNYIGGSLECLDDCSGYYWGSCEGEEACGNGIIGDGEICEIDNVRGRTCVDEGYTNGTLTCHSSCNKYDYSSCGGEKSVCGDGIISGFEDCDVDLGSKTCEDIGYDFGVLGCFSNCSFNLEICFNEDVIEVNESLNSGASVNESINSSIEESEVVPDVSNNVSSVEGLSFGIWLLIVLGVLVVGVIGIWFYFSKK